MGRLFISVVLVKQISRCIGWEKPRAGKLAEVFVYDNFARVPVDSVLAGDICAVTGLAEVSIGDTICDRLDVRPLPAIQVPPSSQLDRELLAVPLCGSMCVP